MGLEVPKEPRRFSSARSMPVKDYSHRSRRATSAVSRSLSTPLSTSLAPKKSREVQPTPSERRAVKTLGQSLDSVLQGILSKSDGATLLPTIPSLEAVEESSFEAPEQMDYPLAYLLDPVAMRRQRERDEIRMATLNYEERRERQEDEERRREQEENAFRARSSKARAAALAAAKKAKQEQMSLDAKYAEEMAALSAEEEVGSML